MKNIFKTAFASLLLMASCSTNDELATLTPTSNTLYAAIEAPQSRTYADENGKLLWTADDRITAFMGNTYPRQYQYTGETGQNYGAFDDLTPQNSVISGNNLDCNYAIYPYDGNTTISNAGVINFTIPATQNYAENSFGLGANVMVAVTKDKNDNFLSFKNLGGYFEFSLYGEGTTVKSIEFKGNNSEDLAGAAAITATYNGTPTFEFTGNTSKTLTLDCGAGVELGTEANPTKFWFVIPAIEYTKGITITITDTEGGVMEKSTSKSITIDRSTVQPLNAFLVETRDANTPPNNQIWYTTSYTDTTDPSIQDIDGNWVVDESVSIVSNEYVEGKGIITFSGDITQICASAFENNRYLTSLTLPNSITTIGPSAFSCCTNLSEIYIPKNVTTIGDRAFIGCENLTTVTIASNNISNMGQRCFEQNFNLTKFISSYASSDNRCLIIDNTLYAFASYGITEYTVPDNIENIGGGVFSHCSQISKITLPNHLESIGDNVFAHCNFEDITIPKSVSSIGKQAFYKTKGVAYIKCDIPSTPSTAAYNFTNPFYESELSVVFSGESIGDRAFEYAKSKSIVLLDGLKSIGYNAFSSCENLETLLLPNSVEAIDQYAFSNCNKLKELAIPEKVKELKFCVFQNCSSLESITIGSGVTRLYDKVFYNCTALKSVKFYSSEPAKLSDSSLYNIITQSSYRRTFDIYVPQSSLEKYKSATGWIGITLIGF